MSVPRMERLLDVHIRLFADDVAKVKKLAAAERIPWQVKLRLLVHAAATAPEPRIR